ncbi:Tubulin polyglutamylase ttll6, partial [Nowakowskiella sp. JEL0078]
MPQEYEDLKIACKSRRPRQAFISKPAQGCQGKGIFLFKSLKDIQSTKDSDLIVQTYIAKPYLLDGLKFDLRLYVLVTSVDPLRVFIYNDGLARFATEPYRRPNNTNLADICMHLTNYAINKKSEKFERSDWEHVGSKRTIKSVLKILEAQGHNVAHLWTRISDAIVKTVSTIQPQLCQIMRACFPGHKPTNLEITSGSCCFEILGFDVILDEKLKPWILEVNHSPSFTCDSDLDMQIKRGVILGALDLVGLHHSSKKRFEKTQKEKTQTRLKVKVNKDVTIASNRRENIENLEIFESVSEPTTQAWENPKVLK